MVILKEGISEGTKVTVENPATNNKVEGKVVRPPQMNQEGSLVPVEFATPSPTFWNIFFRHSLINSLQVRVRSAF